jgi:serine/threonine-protein kinase HipA
MCRIELASMRMAREAGIEVPDVALTETDRGPVLLVERFDQSPNEQHHLVSVASLINKFDITEIDESTMSYPGITQLGKRIGHLTSDLGAVVFRRMLFNVAIGNTDDHLRNHAFMKRAPASDYSFSPGYDIVPQISLQGSHAIAIGPFGSTPSVDNIEAAARRMGVADELAHEIGGEVLEVTATWRDYMSDAGIGASDLAVLERCFALREVVERWHNTAARTADF